MAVGQYPPENINKWVLDHNPTDGLKSSDFNHNHWAKSADCHPPPFSATSKYVDIQVWLVKSDKMLK